MCLASIALSTDLLDTCRALRSISIEKKPSSTTSRVRGTSCLEDLFCLFDTENLADGAPVVRHD